MKKRIVALAVVSLTLLAWPATGWSQAEPAEDRTPAPPANPWGWDSLGLTADEVTVVQRIVSNWQTELTPVWTELQSKNMELQRLMMDPSAEPSAVAEKTKEIGEVQAEIQRMNLEKRKAVREVLTDEQKQLFDQQGLGSGWGSGPCGLGLGVGWSSGFGRGRGRGRGFGRGMGVGPGIGIGMGIPGPRGGAGWGRGPCGMGFGRAQMNSWNGMGRRRW